MTTRTTDDTAATAPPRLTLERAHRIVELLDLGGHDD